MMAGREDRAEGAAGRDDRAQPQLRQQGGAARPGVVGRGAARGGAGGGRQGARGRGAGRGNHRAHAGAVAAGAIAAVEAENIAANAQAALDNAEAARAEVQQAAEAAARANRIANMIHDDPVENSRYQRGPHGAGPARRFIGNVSALGPQRTGRIVVTELLRVLFWLGCTAAAYFSVLRISESEMTNASTVTLLIEGAFGGFSSYLVYLQWVCVDRLGSEIIRLLTLRQGTEDPAEYLEITGQLVDAYRNSRLTPSLISWDGWWPVWEDLSPRDMVDWISAVEENLVRHGWFHVPWGWYAISLWGTSFAKYSAEIDDVELISDHRTFNHLNEVLTRHPRVCRHVGLKKGVWSTVVVSRAALLCVLERYCNHQGPVDPAAVDTFLTGVFSGMNVPDEVAYEIKRGTFRLALQKLE